MQTLTQLRSGQLAGISRLKLAEGLETFPAEILHLADSLEILDLTGNKLKTLPESFAQLKKLKIVFLSDNEFTELPDILGSCPSLEMIGFKANKIAHIPQNAFPPKLRWLILTDNEIPELPSSIGSCRRLQKLMLASNKLTNLPAELANCLNLELLRISANKLTSLPDWLFSLPKLAWLAFAGNPFCFKPAAEANLNLIPWENLELKELLGEGASGLIYKAILKDLETNKMQAAAVKVFKAHVTSDGIPADEMAACLAAGNHPNIVQVLGKIQADRTQKQGLVLKLIPEDYKNLGNPSSFETCTRDTFENGRVLSLKSILTIASGIASAGQHLHARGIMHGDLYAHNILINETETPLFGDFGAASIYDLADTDLSALLERVEVRAFGYLLEDLLSLLNQMEEKTDAAKELEILMQKCLQEAVPDRPDFATVFEQVHALAAALPEISMLFGSSSVRN